MIPELADWQLRALQRAANLRVDPAAINEAVGTLAAVFGDAWLAEACGRDPAHPLPFRRHPVGNFLLPAGEDQVATALELVEYLKFASGSPAFATLVDGLRAQYGTTFLQLAFGFRFARAGATNVTFEPAVRGGRRGDIACSVDGRPIVAECYIPRVAPHSLEVDWLLQNCLELRHGLRPGVLSIAIKLKKTPTAIERKTVVRLVREFSREIDENITAGRLTDDTRYAETDAALISVARTAQVGPGQDSLGRVHARFPDLRGRQPRAFGRIAVGDTSVLKNPELLAKGHPTRDCVAVWLSDADEEAQSLNKDLDEPLDLLGRKLEGKLAQTKLDADTGRVLIVSSWMTAQLHRARRETMDRLRARLFTKHAGVAGLLMVMRTFRHDPPRHRYKITPILPDGADALPQGFLDELLRVERDQSVPPLS